MPLDYYELRNRHHFETGRFNTINCAIAQILINPPKLVYVQILLYL